jgi:hypothetical protein
MEGIRLLLAAIQNNGQSPILNAYRYKCVNGKPSGFQPDSFGKGEADDVIAAVGHTWQSVVPVAASTHFQLALFHVFILRAVNIFSSISSGCGKRDLTSALPHNSFRR